MAPADPTTVEATTEVEPTTKVTTEAEATTILYTTEIDDTTFQPTTEIVVTSDMPSTESDITTVQPSTEVEGTTSQFVTTDVTVQLLTTDSDVTSVASDDVPSTVPAATSVLTTQILLTTHELPTVTTNKQTPLPTQTTESNRIGNLSDGTSLAPVTTTVDGTASGMFLLFAIMLMI